MRSSHFYEMVMEHNAESTSLYLDIGMAISQSWSRDNEVPCLSLGPSGSFDDMHMFAPCVAYENGIFSMWYCGARGAVKERVFRLGLATGTDGIHFTKHPEAPVYDFGDGKHSVLTPTLLRDPAGPVLRENGQLRMWFASTDFVTGDGLHTLHETTSLDGLTWEPPSNVQLEHVYAPTIIKENHRYKMWYVDVSIDPWCIRYGESTDGIRWAVQDTPVLQMDQPWEAGRLFYPTVLKLNGLYLMWYGSYHGPEKQKTALGFALSEDGLAWRKYPENPVFEPDPTREWESHYTTSQSILRLTDGSWRIWYASRTKPPFVHKYFAVGTARGHIITKP